MLRQLKMVAMLLLGLLIAAFVGEGVVRLGALDQNKYVIEMWRYAKELKTASDDVAIGHEHIPNTSASLQGVDVSINSFGMRGPEPLPRDPHRVRIVIIGDSLALGWGVSDREFLRGQLAERLGPGYEVLNAGVGNMNLEQVVALWEKQERRLDADVVLLFSSLRAAAERQKTDGGWLIRHSQLMALVEAVWAQWKAGRTPREAKVGALKARWSGREGTGVIERAMDHLKRDQATHGYRVVVAQMPEPHDFKHYEFGFMGKVMQQEAARHGWDYVDLYSLFQGREASDFWVAPDDPHPNGRALGIIADDLAPRLKR